MGHQYDIFGWYIGQGGGSRSTEISPTNMALTETEGELRANWTGHHWVNLPFAKSEIPAVPPPVPTAVSRRQAKQQLLAMGLLDQVAPLIEALPDDGTRAMMRIYWEDSQEFERHHESLIALATALGLDAAALDAAFVAAAAR